LKLFSSLDYFARYRDYGAFFIRLLVGAFLVWGTQDNVLSYARMEEFAEFLRARGVPLPLAAAFLSAYAQFVCGLLYIAGALVRPAAVVMILNFVAALLIAHLGDSFRGMFPALAMLASSCFLLLHGAGKPSVDERLARRR
jgi:putative oxidoreductase